MGRFSLWFLLRPHVVKVIELIWIHGAEALQNIGKLLCEGGKGLSTAPLYLRDTNHLDQLHLVTFRTILTIGAPVADDNL